MKMKAYKAQSSIEFLVFAGIAFLVVIIFVAASANEVREFRDQKKFFLIKDLALKLQKEVTIAASVENGYERSFNLPDRLGNNLDYFIITKNSTITVNSSKTAFSVRIPNVIGNFTKSTNTIERIDGEIYINKDVSPPGPSPGGPLDETASQLTARIDEPGTPDWHGAKGSSVDIILKLINDEPFDIYLKSFTLTWTDPTNNFKHLQHNTEANGWNKRKIYGDLDDDPSSETPLSGTFDDLGDRNGNLKIPANSNPIPYTIINDLHFYRDVLGTTFTLTINFEDVSFVSLGSSTLSFTIS